MTPVRSRINQNIFGTRLNAALNYRLQEFVLGLVFLKGEIVHVDDEAVISILDFREYFGEPPELVLINLYHAEAVLVVLVHHGLNARGLSGSAVTVEQHIVGSLPAEKGLCILPELLLLALIADEIRELDRIHIAYGLQEHTLLLIVLQTKGRVQSELSNAVSPVELAHRMKKGFVALDSRKRTAQCPHLLADRSVTAHRRFR